MIALDKMRELSDSVGRTVIVYRWDGSRQDLLAEYSGGAK